MDDKERTKDHMHFVIAKGYFETQYTDKKITYEQYEAAVKVLYDKFHMAEVEQWIDANRNSGLTGLEPIQQTKLQKKKDVVVISKAPSEKTVHQYASLTDMARHYNEDSPGYVIQAWLRSHNTIEFLDIWEQENNPNYSRQGYELLQNKMHQGTFSLTPKQWIEQTKATGITSRQGKNGGTYAHPIIACDFLVWLSPEYRMQMLQLSQFPDEVTLAED